MTKGWYLLIIHFFIWFSGCAKKCLALCAVSDSSIASSRISDPFASSDCTSENFRQEYTNSHRNNASVSKHARMIQSYLNVNN